MIDATKDSASIAENGLIAFVGGMSASNRRDIKNAYLFSSLAATKKYDPYTQNELWFKRFLEVFEICGWFQIGRSAKRERVTGQGLKMDNLAVKALEVAVGSLAAGGTLGAALPAVATKAVTALAKRDDALTLFKRNTDDKEGNVMNVLACAESPDGEVVMAMSCVQTNATSNSTNVVFIEWDSEEADAFQGSVMLAFTQSLYEQTRSTVETKLGDRSKSQIMDIDIG